MHKFLLSLVSFSWHLPVKNSLLFWVVFFYSHIILKFLSFPTAFQVIIWPLCYLIFNVASWWLVSQAGLFLLSIENIDPCPLWFTRFFLPEEDLWKTCWWWQEVLLPCHFPTSSPISWFWIDSCPPLPIGCSYSCSSRYTMQIQLSLWLKLKFWWLLDHSLLLFWLVFQLHDSMYKRLPETIAPSTLWQLKMNTNSHSTMASVKN